MLRTALQILWPSFLAAAGAELLFFGLFDPDELNLFGRALGVSRLAAYSLGFFLFWALAAGSSAMTILLRRPSEEINRCPLQPLDRPSGCPKRAAQPERPASL